MKKSIFLIYLEYSVGIFFLTLFRLMPRVGGVLLGRFLGWVGYTFFKSSWKVGMINLDLAFGDSKSKKEKTKILKKSFLSMGETIFEFLQIPRYSNEYVLSRTRDEGMDELREALKEGKGAIVCSAHYSNWEWVATFGGVSGLNVHAVYRPLDNPLLDKHIVKTRASKNVSLLPRKQSVRQGYEVLKNNGILALMIDQNAAVGGIFVPFFGIPASTMRGPSMYHLKTGAPVFFAHDERQENGYHRLVIKKIEMTSNHLENMTRINKYIESFVREKPDFNFWVHPRWKKRPPEEKSFYEGIRV